MTRRLALVTGGCSGIGLSIARSLSGQHDLALVYASSEEKAQTAERELKSCAPSCQVRTFGGRLRSYDDARLLISRVEAEFRLRPTVLVNSIGGLCDELYLQSDFSKHQQIITEHLVVTMALCHLALAEMYKVRFGRIVNIGSISAHYSRRGQCSYSAAKAGIEGFSRTLALEVAHRGITVNVVAPGLIDTPLTASFIERLQQKNFNLSRLIPVGRVGIGDDVGPLVALLCSDQASYITGAVYSVDGGRSLGDSHL